MSDHVATDSDWRQLVVERRRQFRHVFWLLGAIILFLFIFVPYWTSQPDSYDEQRAEPVKPIATWPDGSPKTANDWWANPATAAKHIAAESGKG